MEISVAKQVMAKDGKEMLLIPSGEFFMGSESGYSEEKPVHKVSVEGFYMDKYLVTNREYKAYCDETSTTYPADPHWKEVSGYFKNYPDYPVVNVSWDQAVVYAKWAGKRLPTEVEWEYAARGGEEQSSYPWGEGHPEDQKANYADRNTDFSWRDFRYSTGYQYTSSVGSYDPNGYGLYDMAGNVWQWCDEWFFLYSDTLKDIESFKDGWGGSKVCRGGCYHSSVFDLRVSRRRQVLGGQGIISVGFRCIRDVDNKTCDAIVAGQPVKVENWISKMENKKGELKEGFELCFGTGLINREQGVTIKQLGFTSVEQYVTWETVENKGEGCWDFTVWDEQVAILKEVGLKWVPFLIAGPAYSLPDWYRESRDFEGLCCLEHNIESKIQSIWDKNFYGYIERFIKKIAEHYSADPELIEAPILGITGDFGESIFPVWHGNWPTQIPGLYHSHSGYWCNDRFAHKDFKEKMTLKYTIIDKLNASWDTCYRSFDAIKFPDLTVDPIEGYRVDEYTIAGKYPVSSMCDRRIWMDFVDWYRESMTEYADFWMGITRKYLPNHPIYLCTGGDAVSYHGSDFAHQCKIVSKHGGGVRITNEASKYAQNFTLTNWVASAGNFYKAYFSFEPAGQVTEKGVVCRIFNATATGAKGLHFYGGNLEGGEEKPQIFVENLKNLYTGMVKKDIGVLYPDTSVVLGNITMIDMQMNFEMLRDYTDFQYLDDTTIQDGILDRVRIAIICCGELYRKETLEVLKHWVEQGGILVGYNFNDICSAENDESYGKILFNMDGGTKIMSKGVSFYISTRVLLKEYNPDIIPGTKPSEVVWEESEAYYQANVFDLVTQFLAQQGYHLIDGILDGIYIAELQDEILLLNTKDIRVEREITLIDGSRINLHIEKNSILNITP